MRWNEKGRRAVLIEDVELFGGGVLLEELAGDFPLGGQDDAIGSQYTESCTGERDGFQGIFYLIEAAFGGEDGCLGS